MDPFANVVGRLWKQFMLQELVPPGRQLMLYCCGQEQYPPLNARMMLPFGKKKGLGFV